MAPWLHGLIVAPDPGVDRGAVVEDGQGAMGHIQCSSEGRSARCAAELVVQLPPRTEKTTCEIHAKLRPGQTNSWNCPPFPFFWSCQRNIDQDQLYKNIILLSDLFL